MQKVTGSNPVISTTCTIAVSEVLGAAFFEDRKLTRDSRILYPSYFLKIEVAVCPPKPKVLLST